MSSYTVKYIYHDCFLLETEDAVVIFDFWKDPLSRDGDKDFPPLLGEFNHDKPVYILVSHHHKDHFSKRIFLWSQVLPHVKYIISKDVFSKVKYLFRENGNYQGPKPPPEKVIVLKSGETYRDERVVVKAFSSTDIGNSYTLELNGMRIFHAGDLNAWLWIGESSIEEVENARKEYTRIIEDIKEDYPYFDIVFFPVDSRLEKEYWWGAKYFVEHIKTKLFIPMHFELAEEETSYLRRITDAGAFHLYANRNYGSYLLLAGTRSSYIHNPI